MPSKQMEGKNRYSGMVVNPFTAITLTSDEPFAVIEGDFIFSLAGPVPQLNAEPNAVGRVDRNVLQQNSIRTSDHKQVVNGLPLRELNFRLRRRPIANYNDYVRELRSVYLVGNVKGPESPGDVQNVGIGLTPPRQQHDISVEMNGQSLFVQRLANTNGNQTVYAVAQLIRMQGNGPVAGALVIQITPFAAPTRGRPPLRLMQLFADGVRLTEEEEANWNAPQLPYNHAARIWCLYKPNTNPAQSHVKVAEVRLQNDTLFIPPITDEAFVGTGAQAARNASLGPKDQKVLLAPKALSFLR